MLRVTCFSKGTATVEEPPACEIPGDLCSPCKYYYWKAIESLRCIAEESIDLSVMGPVDVYFIIAVRAGDADKLALASGLFIELRTRMDRRAAELIESLLERRIDFSRSRAARWVTMNSAWFIRSFSLRRNSSPSKSSISGPSKLSKWSAKSRSSC